MKKRSKFLTFLFSLVPGAGQMYLGFMKQGITIMTTFFLAIFLADFLRISFIIVVLPVLWCYGFFDTINKASLSPDELECIEDKSIFSSFFPDGVKVLSGKHMWIGITLIIFGALIFIDNVLLQELGRLGFIDRYMAREYLRTCVASAAIIGIGIKLIVGKKKNAQ